MVAISRREFIGWGAAGVVVLEFPSLVSGLEDKVQDVVLDAYNLRMHGKLDEARKLLERDILENSGNAKTYYELSRLKLHEALGKGGRDTLGGMIDAAQKIFSWWTLQRRRYCFGFLLTKGKTAI